MNALLKVPSPSGGHRAHSGLSGRSRPTRLLGAVVTLVLSFCTAVAQGTFKPVTVIFDGPPLQPPGTARLVQYYNESGVWFVPIPGTDGFTRRGGSPTSFWPDNGTACLQAGTGDSLMFGVDEGSDFGLVSVDLAEWSTAYPQAVSVPFVGYRRDGSTVTETLTTDGIIDGTGPLADFQTLYFGSQFTGVYRVEIPSYGWFLDNVVLSIPEPRTGALGGLGATLLGVRLLGRKKPQ
jgi:hypothetical protein